MTTEVTTGTGRRADVDADGGGAWPRTAAAEWTRLWTVRSSWTLLALAAAMMAGIGLLAGLGASEEGGAPAEAWQAAEFATMPVQMVLLALAVLAVTADYSTGGIVPVLQWTPRRTVLFTGRATVVVLVVTVAGVAVAALAAVVAYLASPDVLTLPVGAGAATALGTVAGVLACGAALAVGLGFLLRSTAGALVTTFLLLLVLPLFLLAPGNPVLVEVARFLPGSSAAFLLIDGGAPGTTTTSAFGVLAAWGLGSLLAGWLRLTRDDAQR